PRGVAPSPRLCRRPVCVGKVLLFAPEGLSPRRAPADRPQCLGYRERPACGPVLPAAGTPPAIEGIPQKTPRAGPSAAIRPTLVSPPPGLTIKAPVGCVAPADA